MCQDVHSTIWKGKGGRGTYLSNCGGHSKILELLDKHRQRRIHLEAQVLACRQQYILKHSYIQRGAVQGHAVVTRQNPGSHSDYCLTQQPCKAEAELYMLSCHSAEQVWAWYRRPEGIRDSPMTSSGLAMSGRLSAIDMACVRMMSTKPATSSAVLLACARIIVTSAPAIRLTHWLHMQNVINTAAGKHESSILYWQKFLVLHGRQDAHPHMSCRLAVSVMQRYELTHGNTDLKESCKGAHQTGNRFLECLHEVLKWRRPGGASQVHAHRCVNGVCDALDLLRDILRCSNRLQTSTWDSDMRHRKCPYARAFRHCLEAQLMPTIQTFIMLYNACRKDEVVHRRAQAFCSSLSNASRLAIVCPVRLGIIRAVKHA